MPLPDFDTLQEADWSYSPPCELPKGCSLEAGFRLQMDFHCEHVVWLFCKEHADHEMEMHASLPDGQVYCPVCGPHILGRLIHVSPLGG